jgi:hypothetical protein
VLKASAKANTALREGAVHLASACKEEKRLANEQSGYSDGKDPSRVTRLQRALGARGGSDNGSRRGLRGASQLFAEVLVERSHKDCGQAGYRPKSYANCKANKQVFLKF